MIKIIVDTREATYRLIKAFDEVSGPKVQLSIMRAINDTLRTANKDVLTGITDRYNLQRQDLASKMKIYKASTTSPLIGQIKYYNKQFSLKDFNPKEIKDGVGTFQLGRGKNKSFASRKLNGLRANKMLVKSGVIVRVLKGQDKVIPSAYLSFSANKLNPSVKAKGNYDGTFIFNEAEKARGLMSVSIKSMLKNESITAKLSGSINSNYRKNLLRELEKRVKGLGEQRARWL